MPGYLSPLNQVARFALLDKKVEAARLDKKFLSLLTQSQKWSRL
jgi:hypothetical protein